MPNEAASPMELEYGLRNAPSQRFHIRTEARGTPPEPVTVMAEVQGPGGRSYKVEVVFESEYLRTKPEFTTEMLEHTAVELVKSHIESHRHQSFRLRLVCNSGLVQSAPI